MFTCLRYADVDGFAFASRDTLHYFSNISLVAAFLPFRRLGHFAIIIYFKHVSTPLRSCLSAAPRHIFIAASFAQPLYLSASRRLACLSISATMLLMNILSFPLCMPIIKAAALSKLPLLRLFHAGKRFTSRDYCSVDD